MIDKVEEIAKDLSIELTKTNLYDVDLVAIKIKAAFKILLDESVVNSHTEKLKKRTQQHIKLNQMNEKTVSFWKNKCRSVFSEEQMQEFYREIDIIRGQ